MTRATANLVINVENRLLHESFARTCSKSGLDWEAVTTASKHI